MLVPIIPLSNIILHIRISYPPLDPPSMPAEMNFYSSERGVKLTRTRRRSLIERALVVSRCRRSRLSKSRSTTNTAIRTHDTCIVGENCWFSCCPICLRDFADECDDICRPISCEHLFHKDCISDWLLQQDSCPLCRAAVVKNLQREEILTGGSIRRRILWTQSSMWNEAVDTNTVVSITAQ